MKIKIEVVEVSRRQEQIHLQALEKMRDGDLAKFRIGKERMEVKNVRDLKQIYFKMWSGQS